MAHGPCLNPNCKSHGMPHPNCRCHPEEPPYMAEGGEIEAFCSKDRKHMPECEYFAEGGDVSSLDAFANTLPDESQQSPDMSTEPMQAEAPSADTSALDQFAATLPDDAHSTPGQMALTGAEGLARGITGGMSDVAMSKARGLAENYSDNPDAWAPRMEDVAARKEANPNIAMYSNLAGLASSVMRGAGAMPLISKGAKAVVGALGLAEAETLATKIAAGALTGAIESGVFQAGDEISKSFLGQGDDEGAVSSALANIGGAALIGGGLGGTVSGAGHGLQSIADSKVASKAAKELKNFGAKWHLDDHLEEVQNLSELNPQFADDLRQLSKSPGGKLAEYVRGPGIDKFANKAVSKAAQLAGAAVGAKEGGIIGALGGMYAVKQIEPYLEKVLGTPIRKASPNVVSAVVKVLSSGDPTGINQSIQYANKVSKGQKLIKDSVDGLFKAGRQLTIEEAMPRDNDKLKQFIEDGGISQEFNPEQSEVPAFAKGGEVPGPQADPIATHFPVQHMMLNATKGRISNYLTAMKPQKDAPKLTFDMPHPDHEQERKYHAAIQIANRPLTVLNKIKKGTLEVSDLQNLVGMYPELHSHLSKKITERILNAQLDDERPSYRTRQAMSLFLGTPLDSTMTPQAIQSIQATFALRQQQTKQPPANSMKSIVKSSKSFQTPEQANERRDVERAK